VTRSGSGQSPAAHLLEVVFKEFREKGDWPFVERLRHQLDLADDELDVIGVGRQLDPGLGRIDVGFEARATLTIHGVASCSDASRELSDCLAVAKYSYARYRSDGPTAKITSDDLARDLGFDALRLAKARELTQWLPGLNGGGGSDGESWHRLVTGDITAFRHVETVAGMLGIAPRPRGLNALSPPPSPPTGSIGPSGDARLHSVPRETPAAIRGAAPASASLGPEANRLIRKLIDLPDPIMGPPQPFSVSHRRNGVARISHFSLSPSWLDAPEAAFQDLQSRGFFLPAPGEGGESYFLVSDAATRLGAAPSSHDGRAREIAPQDIDEFSLIAAVQHIDAAVVDTLRSAYEEKQLEPALRRILGAVDETAHGPKEVADIVAPLHIRGSRRQSAFVNKGVSLRKVTEKAIAHQVIRVPRELPAAGILVLAAVGDIQDDAKGMLAHVAKSNDLDWAILDRRVLARIFVAYGEICPSDGSWLADLACPTCGYRYRHPDRNS
jgi:hypothetical protein